jgi:hypothetical protein
MKKIFILIAVLATMQSCNKFGDTNVNPALLNAASTRALLTNSQQSIKSLVFASRYANFYIQHLSEGPYPASSLYSDRNVSFGSFYTGPLMNLQTIISNNNDGLIAASGNGSKNNQIAAARIMKAYYFMILTDIWGDVPYTEALKGDKQYAPKYDDQKAIYTDLFKELTEAVAQINTTEAGVTGDILFNGKMASWKLFANTMRMGMAIKLSKADAVKGKAEYAAAVAAGVIASNTSNVMYNFIAGDPNNYNPWYDNYTVSKRDDFAISKTMTDYMDTKADPRLKVYAENLAGGVIKGLTYGILATPITAAFSRIGDNYRGQGSPLPIFTYAQVLSWQAEAALLGYTTGGETEAKANYEASIKASMEQHGVYDATKYAAYIANADVAYKTANAWKQVITERWVHTYLNSWDAWNDWRRTGYPVLTPAPSAVVSGGIPYRLSYSTTEPALNPNNYKAVIAKQGADDIYTKMWLFK